MYGRLLSYVTPYWVAFLLSVAGFALYSLSNVGFMQLLAYIVDSLNGQDPLLHTGIEPFLRSIFGQGGQLNRDVIPVSIVIIAISRGLGTFVGNYFINYVGTNLIHNLRCELFDQLLSLPSRFFDKHAMGHLVAKVTYHVTQVTGAATDAVRVLIREGFTVVFFLAYLFYLNWRLTLIFLAVAPFIALLVSYAGKRFRRISARIQNSMGDVTHVASEAVQGYRVVRTFGGTDYERSRFHKVSNDNRRQTMKMVVTSSIATPVVQVVVATALGILVWLVLDPTLLANMSSGDIVAFIGTGGLLAKPIRQLSEVNSTVQRGLAAAEDIFDLFDADGEPDEGTRTLDRVRGKIEFRNVTFSYEPAPTANPVLKQVSFTASPGETIALVGKSGSGKSTLASLIPRFYSPDAGVILLDDIPIEDIKLDDLRAQISIVTQDVTLFNDTVTRNIAYGTLHDADVASIQEAATRAYAWGFISKLEDGLDTVVGDDGVLLSGGQRQRLAIARAFLKDAPILVLDEATSALDSESEGYIQRALDAVRKGRTTIVIAHRLSTIEKADRILVIDDGMIVEQGTHRELLAKHGFYANLHDHQHIGPDGKEVSHSDVSHLEFEPIPEGRDSSWQWMSEESSPLVQAWYSGAGWPKLLSPVSFVYQQVARLRRQTIQSDTNKHWKPPVPTVIVGNISVGGTGKSPLVIAIARQLTERGLKPGIVSRGYGGDGPFPLDVTPTSDPAAAGDEAVMIARRTDCPMVVDPDRPAAVRYLLDKHHCDLVISDDGLQHYALDRDIEIAVVDGERGLGNGLCFPAGPLREPPSRLKEVDFVVINGDGRPHLPTAAQTMNLAPTALVSLVTGERRDAKPFGEGTRIHGVAGIGNPGRFFDTLRQIGYQPVEHRFDDHHPFTLTELIFGDTMPVVMTEKDAVKVRQLNPSLVHDDFWYLEVEAILPAAFITSLLSKLGMNVTPLKVVGK